MQTQFWVQLLEIQFLPSCRSQGQRDTVTGRTASGETAPLLRGLSFQSTKSINHGCKNRKKQLHLRLSEEPLCAVPIKCWGHRSEAEHLRSLHQTGPTFLLQGPSQRDGTARRKWPHPTLHATYRDEDTLGILAATVSFEHTLVIVQHVARLTNAALPASGRDFMARALTAAVRVQAGRWTRGKAVCVVTVSWAFQSCGTEGD